MFGHNIYTYDVPYVLANYNQCPFQRISIHIHNSTFDMYVYIYVYVYVILYCICIQFNALMKERKNSLICDIVRLNRE